MDPSDWQAQQFEQQRGYLRSVALRMLGSAADADDALQEAWLRLDRTDTDGVENMRGWLTTVVSRICLDILRARSARREQLTDGWLPEPVLPFSSEEDDPEREALIADSVALALLVVLETLTPAERLAFVLHDSFGVPFDEIAPILDRSPEAVRQLASRGRRRVSGAAPRPDADLDGQREVVDAFLAAAREGDFERLVAVLDPDVVLRADAGAVLAGLSREVRGAQEVARGAISFRRLDLELKRALVNGAPGAVSMRDGKPFSVAGFSVRGGRIVAMDILVDPERLRALDLTALES